MDGGRAPIETLAALLLASLQAFSLPEHFPILVAMVRRLRAAAVRAKCLSRARLLAALLPCLAHARLLAALLSVSPP
ncbi:hypothetical protein T484DRAFT_1846751 [Baffinella frigidus]|nr:hypothetical protein T484DRAFT_1846751 [Cryptophyta sp. CCMP2293]